MEAERGIIMLPRSMLFVLLTTATAAIPPAIAELYRSVDEDTIRASAACERSEDVHTCAEAPGLQRDDVTSARGDFCYVNPRPPLDPHMNNGGGTRPVGLPFAGRSPVYAQHGIAATSVPLSTMCAIDMLKAGGSAVDGAIAANICEGVVEPMMNGMGGDLMAQVWHGPTKKLHGYNGSGRSPRNVSYVDMKARLAAQGLERLPGAGPLPVSVPGAVHGWWDLHQKFGKLPWASLFQPAIGYAENGHVRPRSSNSRSHAHRALLTFRARSSRGAASGAGNRGRVVRAAQLFDTHKRRRVPTCPRRLPPNFHRHRRQERQEAHATCGGDLSESRPCEHAQEGGERRRGRVL